MKFFIYFSLADLVKNGNNSIYEADKDASNKLQIPFLENYK